MSGGDPIYLLGWSSKYRKSSTQVGASIWPGRGYVIVPRRVFEENAAGGSCIEKVSQKFVGCNRSPWWKILLSGEFIDSKHTVDGRNPAPPGMYKPCKKLDVYHINWCRIWPINRIFQLSPPSTNSGFCSNLTLSSGCFLAQGKWRFISGSIFQFQRIFGTNWSDNWTTKTQTFQMLLSKLHMGRYGNGVYT